MAEMRRSSASVNCRGILPSSARSFRPQRTRSKTAETWRGLPSLRFLLVCGSSQTRLDLRLFDAVDWVWSPNVHVLPATPTPAPTPSGATATPAPGVAPSPPPTPSGVVTVIQPTWPKRTDYGPSVPQSSAIPLLKPHGSLNWGDLCRCRVVVPWPLPDYLQSFRFLAPTDPTHRMALDVGSKIGKLTHCGQGLGRRASAGKDQTADLSRIPAACQPATFMAGLPRSVFLSLVGPPLLLYSSGSPAALADLFPSSLKLPMKAGQPHCAMD